MSVRDRFSARVAVVLNCTQEEKVTDPSFKKECDLNVVMDKYLKKGILPKIKEGSARFGNFADLPSYDEALNRVLAAQDMFMGLPAAVRKKYDNDPGKFIDAAQTIEGQKLLVEFGLATVKLADGKGSKDEVLIDSNIKSGSVGDSKPISK